MAALPRRPAAGERLFPRHAHVQLTARSGKAALASHEDQFVVRAVDHDLWRWLSGVQPTPAERRHEDWEVNRIRALIEDEGEGDES